MGRACAREASAQGPNDSAGDQFTVGAGFHLRGPGRESRGAQKRGLSYSSRSQVRKVPSCALRVFLSKVHEHEKVRERVAVEPRGH